MGFSTKSWADNSDKREQAYHDQKEKEHTEKIKRGWKPGINSGYSEPGYNGAMGKYINNKEEYKEEYKKMKEENPNIDHI